MPEKTERTVENILFERGQFWLVGDTTTMSPETATRGILIVDKDGKISLLIDEGDWRWSSPGDNFADVLNRKLDIAGYLLSTNQFVRVPNAFARKASPLAPNGGKVTELGAFVCVVGEKNGRDIRSQGLVKGLEIPLGQLRAWLDLPMPETRNKENGFEVQYPKEDDFSFSLKIGNLTVIPRSNSSYNFATKTFSVKQEAHLFFKLNTSLPYEAARDLYSDLEDLFLILTNFEVVLAWPKIYFDDGSAGATFYCSRHSRPSVDFSAIESWLLFPAIQNNFASIVDRWFEMRETLGPAVHLYLGAHRGIELYIEHRFVNLVWGLEALHRATSEEKNVKLEEKVSRILEACKEHLKAKDFKWLEARLGHASELSLAERIESTISMIEIGISAEEIKVFAKRCADLRNSISHRGGVGRGGYSKFVLEVHKLSHALDHFYHAAILVHLRIPPEQIREIFLEGLSGGLIKARMLEAGLHIPSLKR